VSLTSHLERSSSPVRRWLEARFPETRGVALEANRRLRGSWPTCPIPAAAEADESLVGTAIDLLLRARLQTPSIERTIATRGAQTLSRDPSIGARAIEVEREAVTGIKQLKPGGRDLTDPEWRELCICCLVLARFEQRARTPKPSPGIQECLIAPLRRCRGLGDFAPMAFTSATIENLEELGRASWQDHKDLTTAQPLVLNPQFELSRALGGADGDLIAGSRLIDLKSTASSRIVRDRVLWQLLGYVLADTNDQYEIHEVGLAALRWRSSISWTIEELMGELAPKGPMVRVAGKISVPTPVTHDLTKLRAEFALMVEKSRPRLVRPLKGIPPRPGKPQA
jgi:hypothetical protein